VIRGLCAELLNSFGYKVITSGNGKESLEIYQMEKDRISLVLSDLITPEMDSRQCLTKMLRINPKAKVVMASGYSESGPANTVMSALQKDLPQNHFSPDLIGVEMIS
jgi:DNA-binding NtrC family response regulator